MRGVRILLLNWRDVEHPRAGGAEVVTMQWARAWADAGAEIVFLSNEFPGGSPKRSLDGITLVRRGNPITQSWHAWRLFRQDGPFDVVVEEINTLPFFSSVWARRKS